MKMNHLITLSAMTLVLATYDLKASDALLTPRAVGNQIRTASAEAGVPTSAETTMDTGTLTPRAAGNKINHVMGVEATVMTKSMASGTPRFLTVAGKSSCASCNSKTN